MSLIIEQVDDVFLVGLVPSSQDGVDDQVAPIEPPFFCLPVLKVELGVHGVLSPQDNVDDPFPVDQLVDHLPS